MITEYTNRSTVTPVRHRIVQTSLMLDQDCSTHRIQRLYNPFDMSPKSESSVRDDVPRVANQIDDRHSSPAGLVDFCDRNIIQVMGP